VPGASARARRRRCQQSSLRSTHRLLSTRSPDSWMYLMNDAAGPTVAPAISSPGIESGTP
jgi:hypothetical protein